MINYFELDITVWMYLYEENMRQIINCIQTEAIGNALCLCYGKDSKNWEEKLIYSIYLNTYNKYYLTQIFRSLL